MKKQCIILLTIVQLTELALCKHRFCLVWMHFAQQEHGGAGHGAEKVTNNELRSYCISNEIDQSN